MFNNLFMEDIKYKAFFTQETDSGFSNSIENLSNSEREAITIQELVSSSLKSLGKRK